MTQLSDALVMQFEFSIPTRMEKLAERIPSLARLDYIADRTEQLSPMAACDVQAYYMLFDWMRARGYSVASLRPEIFG